MACQAEDHISWDSIKILSSKEFEQHILLDPDEDTRSIEIPPSSELSDDGTIFNENGHQENNCIEGWPFKLKLTSDHIRWDSIKIPPSNEFEQHILSNLDEGSRRILDSFNSGTHYRRGC